MEALLRAKGLWQCTQVLPEYFMTTLETLTLKKKDEVKNKFDKALGTIQCFLDPTCKSIAQGSVESARILYQLYLLTILYNTKLKERYLDLDDYVKSIRAVWRWLKDVLLSSWLFMGLTPSFGTQRRILNSRKHLCMEILKKDLTRSFKTLSWTSTTTARTSSG